MSHLCGAAPVPYAHGVRIVRVVRLRAKNSRGTDLEPWILQRCRIMANAGNFAEEHAGFGQALTGRYEVMFSVELLIYGAIAVRPPFAPVIGAISMRVLRDTHRDGVSGTRR
jgi:hypothetical protein